MRPAIADKHCFTVSMIEVEPGQGAGLHAHDTEEVFIPMNGKFAVYWGDDGENEIELDAMDTVSVPIGIYRGFKNVSDKPATLHFIVGGPDTGKVHWHPSVIDAARETGVAVDDNGLLVELN